MSRPFGTEPGRRSARIGSTVVGLAAGVVGVGCAAVPVQTDAATWSDAPGLEALAVPTCVASCASSADCEIGVPPWAARNFACEAGACRWLGCLEDGDCNVLSDGVCRPRDGAMDCMARCTTSADCGRFEATSDADNFVCETGACRWLGCLSDFECATESTVSFLCRSFGGRPECTRPCFDVLDCARADADEPYTTDNFACEAGACRWLGCRSDAECIAPGAPRCR